MWEWLSSEFVLFLVSHVNTLPVPSSQVRAKCWIYGQQSKVLLLQSGDEPSKGESSTCYQHSSGAKYNASKKSVKCSARLSGLCLGCLLLQYRITYLSNMTEDNIYVFLKWQNNEFGNYLRGKPSVRPASKNCAHARWTQQMSTDCSDADCCEMVLSMGIWIRDIPATGSGMYLDAKFCPMWMNCVFKILATLDGDAFLSVPVLGTQ